MTLSQSRPLVLVGAGKMGGALLSGWLAEGLDPACVFVQDPAPLTGIADWLPPGHVAQDVTASLVGAPGVIVLAVKPQVMHEVLPLLGPIVTEDTLVLSIAAGCTLQGLAAGLPERTAIVRSMPNTPAAIGRGITVACANAHVTDEQRQIADDLLAAVGSVAWVADESLLDPVTAISGSGPAYVFLLVECLAAAGREQGLPDELAERLAVETVAGAGELLRRSEEEGAAELRINVTSPGGTTAAALEILMGEGGLDALLRVAVDAATRRSRDLAS